MTEFDLIRRFFNRPAPSAVLGAGDDCALLKPTSGMQLAVSTDMLVEGRHFAAGAEPRALGHKSLAVNLSDLAAMGADARWVLLSIALPAADEAWLEAFSAGFYALAETSGVELIGGDTTRGPLCISITVLGEAPPGLALRRDGARAGDDIWVSGSTGDAALGLAHSQGRVKLAEDAARHCLERLHRPQPRLELGGRLRGLASSALDVSDGLVGDLSHILEASGVAARLELQSLPRSAALGAFIDAAHGAPANVALAALAEQCMLAGGDDYELLFTAPRERRAAVEEVSADLGLALTRIGRILTGAPEATVCRADGSVVQLARAGFDHFSTP